MKPSSFDKSQLLSLIGQVLDGELSAADREALRVILKASPEARQFYHDQMDLHTRLVLDYTGLDIVDFMPPARSKRNPSRRKQVAAFAAAACVALAVIAIFLQNRTDSTFALLETARNARWENSSLPTDKGTRLGQGTLRLAEGLATLRFDSGAQITIEAPAELTLHDAMTCSLGKGTVVADVPESAIGFKIETSSARITDYGTRFSVTVDHTNMKTHTQVFDGMVTVRNKTSNEIATLNGGQQNFTEGSLTKPSLGYLSEPRIAMNLDTVERDPGWVIRETNKDAYIGNRTLGHDSRTLLYVKNGERGSHRKAYLGFDLKELAPEAIMEAELLLHFAPTGWGLASHVPDATFGVYGLIHDEPWGEDELKIGSAPANIPGTGAGLIEDEVVKLGSFMVRQGEQKGQFGISGETLAEFLCQRAGTTLTLIVVRETEEIGAASLIHGFASHRHPYLPGPSLAIRVSEEQK